MSNLAKRIATAAVLVPAVVAALYLDAGPWSVTAFAAVVACLALDEYLRMALPSTEADRAVLLRVVTGALAAAIVVLPIVWGPALVLAPLLSGGAVAIGFATLARPLALADAGRHIGVCLAGLVYVPLLMTTLPLLKHVGAAHWVTVTLCMAFFSDTVAYTFGRLWGKRKLYPAVSPKKTVEGAVGGIVGSCLATIAVGSLWLLPSLPISHAIVLGVLGSIVGQAGDLVESMIKRTYGVKDSGAILPGHGGMLDRIDAMLFVTPLVYYYVGFFAA